MELNVRPEPSPAERDAIAAALAPLLAAQPWESDWRRAALEEGVEAAEET